MLEQRAILKKKKELPRTVFKRACFNWGIGRELYTAPFIWIPSDVAEIQKKDGKYMTRETFQVIWISYNENREINALEITNERGRLFMRWARNVYLN